tara:strand:+ start:1234 stop:1491 length:258 start_codon:yes stop_codon:yes gene_type:complete
MNHREKMLKWIDDLGLIVIHTEIKPYGKGTRRYMIGRHVEEPVRSHQLASGKWQMSQGKQEWLTEEPLTGIELEKWLKEYSENNQ